MAPKQILAGTTALFLKSPYYLCMATDSMIASIGQEIEQVGLENKITILGNRFAYMKAGIYRDAHGTFDIDRIIHQSLMEFDDLEDVAERAADSIQQSLPNIIDVIRETNPEYYNNRLLNKRNAICVAFIWGDMQYSAFSFDVLHEGVAKNEITTEDEAALLSFGCHEEIDTYLDRNANPLRRGLRPGFEYLIGLEAEANPNLVSLPVHILSLSNRGFLWL